MSIMYIQGIVSVLDSLAGKARILLIYPFLWSSYLPWYPNTDLKIVLYVRVRRQIISCKLRVLNPDHS